MGSELWKSLLVMLIYCALALPSFWDTGMHLTTHIAGAWEGGDFSWQVWFMGWIPYALEHGHNPLFSLWMNVPMGINLAQGTNMALLGFLAIPITLTLGPLAAYNLFMWVAIPISALAMYLVMRRVTGSRPAAFISGLVYGFTSYEIGQAYGHLMLSFIPLPPIILYVVYRIVVLQKGTPRRNGLLLALLLTAQFLISSEVMATTVFFGAVGAVVILVARRSNLDSSAIRYMLASAGLAAAVALPLIAYPVYFMLRGPGHYTGIVWPPINAYHVVALGPLIPTVGERFHVFWPSHVGTTSDPLDSGFLGFPLVLLALVFLIWFRRNRALVFAMVMALFAYVLSLGPRLEWTNLKAGGSIPLPGALLGRVPLLNNLLPGRLSLYQNLFLAAGIGIGVTELIKWNKSRARTHAVGRPLAWNFRSCVATVLGVLALWTVIPNWPLQSSEAKVPAFFVTSMVDQIPAGTPVVIYPYPVDPLNQGMTWQSAARMRFKIMGGYGLFRGTNGQPATEVWDPPVAVPQYLAALQSSTLYPMPQISQAELVKETRIFVSTYGVSAVVVAVHDAGVPNVPEAVNLFNQAFGSPRSEGGVLVWLHPH
jgi:hypothetical protein